MTKTELVLLLFEGNVNATVILYAVTHLSAAFFFFSLLFLNCLIYLFIKIIIIKEEGIKGILFFPHGHSTKIGSVSW